MKRSERPVFVIDTFEKAKTVLDALSYDSRFAHEKLEYMIGEYPELMWCTHQNIAEVMIMERETITRAIKILKGEGKWNKPKLQKK